MTALQSSRVSLPASDRRGGSSNGKRRGVVLVVDDDAINRRILSEALALSGYEIQRAASGREALQVLDDSGADLVLLDVTMPGMNGIEVLKAIRERRGPAQLPVVMATSNGDTETTLAAFNAGANDYVMKPFNLEIILARITTHVTLKQTAEQLEAANRRLDTVNRQMQDNLEAAAQVQRHRLPEPAPRFDRCQFAWWFQPCERVGGDYLNIFPLDDSHIAFYILDVSGHGVQSALMSCAASWILQPVAHVADERAAEARPADEIRYSPLRVARALNDRFAGKRSTGQFLTMMYAVLDLRSLRMCYVSTGHPCGVHLPAEGGTQLLEGRGLPIGLIPTDHERFIPYSEHELQLSPGDRLCFYTDGVADLLNVSDELFGTARLANSFESHRGRDLADSLHGVITDADAWSDHAPFRDDISMLVLEIDGD